MPAYRDYQYAPIDVSASGNNTVISHAGPSGSEIRVVSYVIIAAGAVTAQWRSPSSTARSGVMSLAANSGLVAVAAGEGASLINCLYDSNLILTLGGAVQVAGHVAYYYEKD